MPEAELDLRDFANGLLLNWPILMSNNEKEAANIDRPM